MANPKIFDTQGREIRIQLSKDMRSLDIYAGPEKKIRRSPVRSIWAAHRLLDTANAKRFFQRAKQLAPKLKT